MKYIKNIKQKISKFTDYFKPININNLKIGDYILYTGGKDYYGRVDKTVGKIVNKENKITIITDLFEDESSKPWILFHIQIDTGKIVTDNLEYKHIIYLTEKEIKEFDVKLADNELKNSTNKYNI